MRQAERYLKTAFTISCFYLLVIILGGFFILPGFFRVGDYSFPVLIELFLKTTSAIVAVVVLFSAIIISALTLLQKPQQRTGGPTFVAAITLLVGLVFICCHALYVKLRSCPIDGSDAWYCQVEGKEYVGMVVLAFFLASLAGCIAWVAQKIAQRKHRHIT